MKAIKGILYVVWQCTWGFLQSLVGFFYMLRYINCRHEWYHGSYVTYFTGWAGGISLGMFIFVAEMNDEMKEIYAKKGIDFNDETHSMLRVHEYGHTIQSLILGPLYLFVVGIPSITWAKLKKNIEYREKNNIAYTSYWCEKQASELGSKVTGLPAWDK